MPVIWEGDKYLQGLERQVSDNLMKASQFLVNQIKTKLSQGQPPGPPGGPPHVGKGILRNSIDYETVGPMVSKVGVTQGLAEPYALIQEFGGHIAPKLAKALAIPIHPSAKKATGPRAFSDLVYIKSKKGTPLLVRPHGKGTKSWDLMYVLVGGVTLPARPYLRPALDENYQTITNIIAGGQA